jgi:hypothetical protein
MHLPHVKLLDTLDMLHLRALQDWTNSASNIDTLLRRAELLERWLYGKKTMLCACRTLT